MSTAIPNPLNIYTIAYLPAHALVPNCLPVIQYVVHRACLYLYHTVILSPCLTINNEHMLITISQPASPHSQEIPTQVDADRGTLYSARYF